MSLVKCGKNYRSLNCLAWQGRQRKGKAPAGEVLHAAQVGAGSQARFARDRVGLSVE